MAKRLTKLHWVGISLVLIVFGLCLKVHQLSSDLARYNDDLTNVAETALTRTAMQSMMIANERAVVDPVGSLVYLPEFKIKLPLNDVSKTIAYTMRDNGSSDSVTPASPEADVTSFIFPLPGRQTTMDCSKFVRLKLETKPAPYSPHEKATSVKLADGQTLQIYEFVNDHVCAKYWNQSPVKPSALAAEFLKAKSY
jgi:hypothetical protein